MSSNIKQGVCIRGCSGPNVPCTPYCEIKEESPKVTSKTQEFNIKLKEAKQHVEAGTTWQHYKGGVYKIYDHVILTDDGQVGIEYYRIDGPDFDSAAESQIHFVRPFSEWFDTVFVETHPGFTPDAAARFTQVKKQNIWVPDEGI